MLSSGEMRNPHPLRALCFSGSTMRKLEVILLWKIVLMREALGFMKTQRSFQKKPPALGGLLRHAEANIRSSGGIPGSCG
jgi:hypothetical protein